MIVGARFTEPIDLNNANLGFELSLNDSFLEQGAKFRKLRSERGISLSGSKVSQTLDMTELHIDQNLAMSDEGTYAKVNLKGAQIGGQFDLSRSRLTDTLFMFELRVGQDLFMEEATFNNVNLQSAHIGWELSLKGSKVNGNLEMDGLQVGSLVMIGQAQFADVSLTGAHVTKQLDLSKSQVTGSLKMNRLEAADGLYMDGGKFNDVDLRTARIGKELDLSQARVTGTLNMERVTVTGGVFLGESAEFDGSIYFVFGNCESLQLAGGIFHQNLNLTGTRITTELNVGMSRYGAATWPGTPALVLRNVTVDAIQDLPNSWPSTLDLVGFTYRNLGGLGSIADRDAEWFVDWLSRSRFSPQPYEQIARILRTQGRPGEANTILYAGRERERLDSSGSLYLWLSTLKIIIGYGYRVWLAIIWLNLLWIFGAFVQWTRPAARNKSVVQLLMYSFEMLLPFLIPGDTKFRRAQWFFQNFNIVPTFFLGGWGFFGRGPKGKKVFLCDSLWGASRGTNFSDFQIFRFAKTRSACPLLPQ